MGAPVRFQKAVPRSKENAAVGRREARRSALWAGNPVRRRDWSCRKADQRPRRSAAANFGAPLPSDGGAKGSKPTIWTEARRDVPRGNAPARVNNICTKKDDVENAEQNIGASKGREIASLRSQ